VNDGLINESITTLYIGIPLPNTGLCLPVANETNQDNSQIPYTGDRGWSDKLEAFCRAVDVNIVGQAIGKLKQIVETIAPTSNEVGEIDLGLSEGVIFQVIASVTGVSDDCDVEFAAAAYGSPDNQYEIGSREVEEFDVIKNISESVAALSNVVGYVDINLSEGMVFKVTGAVTGSSDDCNIEFSASAYGSPTNLYEVGQDSEGITLWNPSVDGNWEDRNAWGFDGLTAGRLYYRLSNNDVNPITIDVQIKIVGNVVSTLTEPAWNPDVDGVWDDRGAWGFTGLTDGKLYYRVTNNGTNSIVMTVQIKAVGFENALV
jgi:hypothetical protein